MMQKLLLCAGVHSQSAALDFLQEVVAERHPDGILFAGGILKPDRECGSASSLWGLTPADARFVETFFRTLGRLRVFSALIHGPAGVPLEEFVRPAMQTEMLFPNVHCVHATLIEEKGMALCGLGGTLSDQPLIGIDWYSRGLAEFFLRPLAWSPQPRKVLLFAAPPPGPLGGLDGNPLIGDLIDTFHPNLCVVAGSSARHGAQRIGHTLVVNPGCLADGWLAWFDGHRPAAERVEFIRDRRLSKASTRGVHCV
jgi:hypothetical protein